jgi:hypothetical protein
MALRYREANYKDSDSGNAITIRTTTIEIATM